jgi:hypothetical protein
MNGAGIGRETTKSKKTKAMTARQNKIAETNELDSLIASISGLRVDEKPKSEPKPKPASKKTIKKEPSLWTVKNRLTNSIYKITHKDEVIPGIEVERVSKRGRPLQTVQRSLSTRSVRKPTLTPSETLRLSKLKKELADVNKRIADMNEEMDLSKLFGTVSLTNYRDKSR